MFYRNIARRTYKRSLFLCGIVLTRLLLKCQNCLVSFVSRAPRIATSQRYQPSLQNSHRTRTRLSDDWKHNVDTVSSRRKVSRCFSTGNTGNYGTAVWMKIWFHLSFLFPMPKQWGKNNNLRIEMHNICFYWLGPTIISWNLYILFPSLFEIPYEIFRPRQYVSSIMSTTKHIRTIPKLVRYECVVFIKSGKTLKKNEKTVLQIKYWMDCLKVLNQMCSQQGTFFYYFAQS